MDNNLGKVGLLIGVAIMIIVGVIFLQTSAQAVGDVTNTVSVVNSTYTAGANGETFYITDYKVLTDVVVRLEADGVIIDASEYTVTNNVVYNGAESVTVTVDSAAHESADWDITATAQPLTYVKDAGSRAMANLIPIMFALALLTIALYPVIKDGFGGMN